MDVKAQGTQPISVKDKKKNKLVFAFILFYVPLSKGFNQVRVAVDWIGLGNSILGILVNLTAKC